RQQDEIRQVRSRDVEIRTRQQKEIHKLRALLKKTQAPPASPSSLTKAKEPRQPSSYKPPQSRTCKKHLPDCQPFQCTKYGSTFPSNTTLHKHIRGCRRTKDVNGKIED
ncbi:uncharacterized protein K441DRAFT_672297, partial [Cenococcum geophilum 1.58]